LPLDRALKIGFEGPGHWAYTETVRTCDEKGRLKKETVVRFDPSKPYPEQYTPLSIDGKPPTAGDIKDYRRRGEKRGERLEKAANEAEAADAKKPKSLADEVPSIEVGGLSALMDFEHATLLSEDEIRYRYAVPLLRKGPHSLPVDKLQLTVDVAKGRNVLLRGSIRVLSSFYVKVVAKIREGDMSIEWKTIDPKYPPVTVARGGQALASVLFIKLGGSEQTTRTDFKRVKPYGERFEVEIGPLKKLPF
jgi:hypothetical protein